MGGSDAYRQQMEIKVICYMRAVRAFSHLEEQVIHKPTGSLSERSTNTGNLHTAHYRCEFEYAMLTVTRADMCRVVIFRYTVLDL
jgi:hypothetical protein